MTLSQNLSLSIFDVFDRDFDEVVLLINFYIILGNENPTKEQESVGGTINDGFWDF